MARWRPGAQERLQAAALERFAAQGFDGTTVAEIAATAGLTERTFFRYYADKREVLFHGQDAFERIFLEGLARSVATAPIAMVTDALDAAGGFFVEERRPWSRARQAVIDSEPSLQERELLKLSSLSAALGRALRDRGVDEPAATLVAQTGVAVFRVSFAAWIADGERRSLPEIQRRTVDDLRTMMLPAGFSPDR